MGRPISELIQALKKLDESIDNVLLQTASVMAEDAVGLANSIIVEQGFGATYSQKTVPAFFFYGKELKASGKKYIESLEDNPESDGTNWGDFRKAQGRQNAFVDLNYSTKMWGGMRPDEPQKVGSTYFCFIGHNNREGRDKMNWNFERYGDFIGKALEDQEDILREVAEENIRQILDSLFKK